MLTQLEIENYQSLRKASIPLGKFTVVTGPTGSGKSALIRALQLLALNAPGTSYVRTGAGTAKVGTGDQEQGWFAAIERHRGRSGKDSYRLALAPRSGDEPVVQEYTKLAGKVPDDIASALQLNELNFAKQFDHPYLLDATGSAIAKVLGELTNVTIVLNAAQEAGRLRKGLDRDLKAVSARVERLTEQAQGFAGLAERRAAISEAESHLEAATALQGRVQRLQSLVAISERAHAVLEQATAVADSMVIPSTEKLDDIETRLHRVRELAGLAEAAETAITTWGDRERESRGAVERAHVAVHDALVSAGNCPMCGQPVRGADGPERG